jgi:hypothetical protein
MKLLDYRSNEFSQHGEDGMIEKVWEWLGVKTGLCVEFGAWEGYKFSNTARLWTRGWGAVLIEADEGKAKQLAQNVKPYPKVKAVQKRVGLDFGTRWDRVEGAKDADFVSIDIDGNDYWIFKESPAGPKLYVVEYNTTVPAWLDLYTPYAPDNYFGCSLAALARLAQDKGYAYIGSTKSNGFFLRSDLLNKIPALECDLKDAANQDELVYLMTSFAGEYKETMLGPYGRTRYYDKAVLTGGGLTK